MRSLRRSALTIAVLVAAQVEPATADAQRGPAAPDSEPRILLIGDPALNARHLGAETYTRRILIALDQEERQVGDIRTEITVIEINGRPALRIVEAITSALLGSNTGTAVLDRVTLAPLSHRSEDARGTLTLEYRGDSIVGVVTPAGGSPQPVAVRPDTALFDANGDYLILRSLTLDDGYAVRYPLYLHDAGGKVWATSRVVGSDRLAGEQGATIDTWIVESTIGAQSIRHWVSKDSREVLQSALDLAPGVQVRVVR